MGLCLFFLFSVLPEESAVFSDRTVAMLLRGFPCSLRWLPRFGQPDKKVICSQLPKTGVCQPRS
jgi:hypothetical protein